MNICKAKKHYIKPRNLKVEKIHKILYNLTYIFTFAIDILLDSDYNNMDVIHNAVLFYFV